MAIGIVSYPKKSVIFHTYLSGIGIDHAIYDELLGLIHVWDYHWITIGGYCTIGPPVRFRVQLVTQLQFHYDVKNIAKHGVINQIIMFWGPHIV